jgi:hypothetical protein
MVVLLNKQANDNKAEVRTGSCSADDMMHVLEFAMQHTTRVCGWHALLLAAWLRAPTSAGARAGWMQVVHALVELATKGK